jgi:hypothetical protein
VALRFAPWEHVDVIEILTACALMFAAAAALFAWIADSARVECRKLHSHLSSWRLQLLQLEHEHESLVAQHRKLRGAFYGGRQSSRAAIDGGPDGDWPFQSGAPHPAIDLDPELAAELALQNAPAASPGKANGR